MTNTRPRASSGVLARLCVAIAMAVTLSACNSDSGDAPAPVAAMPVQELPAQALQPVLTDRAVNLGTPVSQAATLRKPETDVNGNSHVGLVVMHPYSSYTDFRGCTDLAARGYTVLCINSSFTNNQYGYYGYEQHAPAIRAGINYLRGLPGITKVVLFGHSMGGR